MQKCVCVCVYVCQVRKMTTEVTETNFVPSLTPTRRSQRSRASPFSVSLLQFEPFISTVSQPDDRKCLLRCL